MLVRVMCLVALGTCVAWGINRSAKVHGRSGRPAGFARGVLHGALMPLAMPHLLLGNDVTIYAENNTGRNYKLGYTVGVNGCGMIFFGFLFWRLSRWRKQAQNR